MEFTVIYGNRNTMKTSRGAIAGFFGQQPNSYTVETILDNSTPEPMSGCWLWDSGVNQWGYGKMSVQGKHWLAHRLSYFIHKGEIPCGMFVMHNCDNRRCVNPGHLKLGTHDENMSDMVSRGRSANGNRNTSRKNPHLQVRGSRCAQSKLNEKQVVKIKKMLIAGYKQEDIAKKFGVLPTSISNIHVGLSWTHVALSHDDIKDIKKIKNRRRKRRFVSKKLKELEVLQIKRRLLSGESQTDIAKTYGVTKQAIFHIKSGRSWKHLILNKEAKGMADLFDTVF